MFEIKSVILAIQNSNRHFGRFLKRVAPEALGLFLGCEFLYLYFIRMGTYMPDTTLQITVVLGEVTTGLLEFVFLTMLTPLRLNEVLGQQAQKEAFWPYAMRRASAFCLESLRALGMSLLWLLALILPGVIKYLRYTFVPYIVLTDPKYDQGEVDALERSNELVRGITLQLFILLFVFGTTEYGQTYVRKAFPIDSHWLIGTLTFALSGLISLYGNVLLYELYLVRNSAKKS